MNRGKVLCSLALDPAAYIEKVEEEHRLFHDGKTTVVCSDTAKWVLQRLRKYIRSYEVGAGRRFVCVFPCLRESLFHTFAVRDGMESLGRDELTKAVVEDAYSSVEYMIKQRLLSLPEPVVVALVGEAKRRVDKLFHSSKKVGKAM